MFSQASVCPRAGEGVHPPRQTAPGQTPLGTPPRADTPQADTDTPPEMATAAGGTHPTGMHSCFDLVSYGIVSDGKN